MLEDLVIVLPSLRRAIPSMDGFDAGSVGRCHVA